jgi:predicted phosphodiesterase
MKPIKEKRTFVIGDVHGQLDLLKTLERKIEKECGNAGYEIVLTGDVMDRGPKSYEVYRYITDHPDISSVLGNHDDFYIGSKIKLMHAFVGNNGGRETFDNMLSYYSDAGNKIPEISSKPGLKLSTDIQILYFHIKDLFTKYPQLTENIKAECDGTKKSFLLRVFSEMRESLKKHPYIRTFEKNGNKFVLTHSGYVPTHKDGRIKTNEELKQIAVNGSGSEKDQIEKILWARKEIKNRVNNHIILHGHTPALTGENGHGPNYCKKSDDLVSVNRG